MKNTLGYALVFIMGLGLGYLVNIFFTNKSYHDLSVENKRLIQRNEQLESEILIISAQSNSRGSAAGSTVQIPTHASEPAPLHQGQMPAAQNPFSKTLSVKNNEVPPGSVRLVANDVDSLEKMQEFLKATAPSDIMGVLQSRKPVDKEAAVKLNGLFSGQILFFEDKRPKDPKWEIEIATEGEFQNNKFVGKMEMRMFDSKGKEFSTSKAGAGSTLKKFSLGPDNSIIIEVRPNDFIQIYNFTQLDRWSGHYFKQLDVGKMEQQGVVHLFKR